MVYLTKENVLARIKSTNLDVITEGDDDVLDPHELDAVNTVSSYLAHEYDTTLIFRPLGTAGFTFDPTVMRCVIDIMLYNLHNSRVNPRNIPENIVVKRDDAIDWLKDVADPRTNTKAAFLPKIAFAPEDRRNNEMAWGSAPKRQNRY